MESQKRLEDRLKMYDEKLEELPSKKKQATVPKNEVHKLQLEPSENTKPDESKAERQLEVPEKPENPKEEDDDYEENDDLINEIYNMNWLIHYLQ